MTIINETLSEKIGAEHVKVKIYEGLLVPMKEIIATANGGIKIRLHSEDEFGLDSWTEIIFEPEELTMIKNALLFNDIIL